MKSFQSAIVIPCYNEANRLNVGAFDRFMALHPDNTFVFVNDGSTDQTFEVLERLRENHPSCVVLNIKQNGGKAEAVRSGLMYALDHLTASVVGFWDADLATHWLPCSTC
jgi:dolichyl-phosphate beta-glucosyltransferase